MQELSCVTAVDRYARTEGFALREYFMDCIRHGNSADIEARINDSCFKKTMADFIQMNHRAMCMGFTFAWAQYSRAAVEGGLEEAHASDILLDHAQRLEKTKTADEILNLNTSLLLSMSHAVAVKLTRHGRPPLANLCKDLIRSHIYDNITLQEISETLHFSPGYISRAFRQTNGMTIQQYTQKAKAEEAKTLLRFTQMPIAEITSRLGYSSQSHFGKAFRSQTGLTPRQYRESVSRSDI